MKFFYYIKNPKGEIVTKLKTKEEAFKYIILNNNNSFVIVQDY